MKINFKILFLTAILNILVLNSYAGDAVYQRKKSDDVITIVATKNPQNAFEVPFITTKINMQETQYQNSTTNADIFTNKAGIEIQGGPVRNAQQFSMRGYSANGIIFLLDGTRQNFGGVHLSNIFLDPSLLKQVEVVKGSSSAIYGSGGLGGVISFETKDAKDLLKEGQKFGFMQKVGYFSANHEKSSISTIYGASDKIDAIANITYRDSGTIRLGGGDRFNLADSKVKSGMAKVNYSITDEQKLKFNLQGYENDSTELTNPQLFASSQEGSLANKESKSSTMKIGYEYKPKDNKLINFTTQVYRIDTEVSYSTLLDATLGVPAGRERSQKIATNGFDAQNVSIFDNNQNFTHRITYGLNYFEDIQSSNSKNPGGQPSMWNLSPNGKSKIAGIFVQDEMKTKTKIGDFSVIPSARYDNYKNNAKGFDASNDEAFSPRLAAGYMPTKWLNIFSNIGKAFRAPTTSEKYTQGSHFFGNTFLPSPNLEAEKNTTYEAGLGLNFNDVFAKEDTLQFKGSYFHTKAQNYISQMVFNFSMIPYPGFRNTQYQNVDSAKIDGVDLTVEYKTQKITAQIGYNETVSKDNKTNQYLASTLPKTIKTNFAYNFMKDSSLGFRSTFASRLTKAGPDEKGNVIPYAGYASHDIYAQYNHKDSIIVAFAVNNMFDKRYQKPYTIIPQHGRDYRISVSYKY